MPTKVAKKTRRARPAAAKRGAGPDVPAAGDIAARPDAASAPGTSIPFLTPHALILETTNVPPPLARPLKAYAFDPSLGRFIGNEMMIEVKYEKLLPGPIGQKVAVIDYDGANKVFYKPVDLDDPGLLIRGGLSPSESDPRFHQQMVYAVVSDTVQHYEAALGRRVRWRNRANRLNLYPHAMVSANAAYSRAAEGILFGYFRASQTDPGRNLPGQTVFTCLSHDIIVHETTHAILDGMRPFFAERTNPDVAAFHEAFADLAALFRHFSHKEALLDTIQKTGGRLYEYHLQPDAGIGNGTRADGKDGDEGPSIQAEFSGSNPLVGLAQQFGEARGTGRALRSALGYRPDPTLIKNPDLEAHERGAILVSAVFDAYFTVYLRRTTDLFRIFRAGGGTTASVELSSSMANMLAGAASRTAEDFFQICVRAIDYCPPVDITFGDYLRAVMTADRDMHPTDNDGVRDAFMQAFRLRGIVPLDAEFFSEDALCWPPVPPTCLPPVKAFIEEPPDSGSRVERELIFGDPNGLTRQEQNVNARVLGNYAKQNAALLGFRPGLPIQVPSFHPAFRLAPDGSLRVDMVVNMLQKYNAPFDPNRPQLGTFPVRGGVTLLIAKPSLVDGLYPPAEIRYLIQKRLDPGGQREERQRRFSLREGLQEGKGEDRFLINFNLLHGGI
ncbi:MAG: hypothetical protein QOJ70_2475 [Acidobacteriota bacterium]|jgi:hypothetical protein|nr:hypothetical protein [Acidobacteriota bacterium]